MSSSQVQTLTYEETMLNQKMLWKDYAGIKQPI